MRRRLLKEAVRRTRGLWPFGSVYRRLYWLGLHVFVAVFGRSREVRSIYLRGSLSSGQWVPGDSDVDLTVVIDDLDPRAEAGFLKRFWKRLRALEGLIPFIRGEDVALLTLTELSQADLAQQRFAPFPEASIERWKLLRGDERREKDYAAGDRASVIRQLRYLYCSLFNNVCAEPSLERASLRQYHRLALKVLILARRLKKGGGLDSEALVSELARDGQERHSEDLPERIVRCLYGVLRLTNDVCRDMPDGAASPGASPKSIVCPEGPREDLGEGTLSPLRRFLEEGIGASPWLRGVVLVPDAYTNTHDLHVILDSGCPLEGFRPVIHRVREGMPLLARLGVVAYVMPEEVFKRGIHFPRSYNYCCALLRHGKMLHGHDLRASPGAPADDDIAEGLRRLSFVWAPLNARRLLEPFAGAGCRFDAWEAVYALMNYRLVTEKRIFPATLRHTGIEYPRHYAREAETRWLSDFHEMVLSKSRWDTRTLENLYFFARHLLCRAAIGTG